MCDLMTGSKMEMPWPYDQKYERKLRGESYRKMCADLMTDSGEVSGEGGLRLLPADAEGALDTLKHKQII